MISESIKTTIGEDLTTRLEEALKGKGKDGADIDLVVGNDGSYVPSEKLDNERAVTKLARDTLQNAVSALKEIGGSGDPAKFDDDVKAAKAAIKDLEKEHANDLANLQRNHAVRFALHDQVHDPEDIIGRLQMDKIELDDQGNLKTDLDGLLKPLRETKGYLFKQQEANPDPAGDPPPVVTGVVPAESGGHPDAGAWNPSADSGIKLNPVFKTM